MPGSLGHEKPAPAPSTTASSVKTGMLCLDTHKLKARCSSVCTAVRRFSAPFLAKRPLARLLSTFLCCLAIVVRPVARLGGRYAFLVLPFQALIFGVQESLAQQLELSVLNTMGALTGIGFSTLGKYVAARAPYGSARSRATCAMFLIVISFFAGVIKSRLPRLTLSMRISLFVSIWLLSINIGVRDHVLIDSGNFLYAAVTPMLLSLIALLFVMCFVRWSSSSFEREMAATFAVLQRCLTLSMDTMAHRGKLSDEDAAEYNSLRAQLFQRSIMLNETYSQAAFELRIGRLSLVWLPLLAIAVAMASTPIVLLVLSLKSIRPLIGIVEHLRRELAWGMSALQPKPQSPPPTPRMLSRASSPRASVRHPGSPHSRPAPPLSLLLPAHSRFTIAIQPPALALGHAIVAALQAVERLILVTFDQDRGQRGEARAAPRKPSAVKGALVVRTMQKLLDAMTGLRKIRENIPRRETVSSVFNERREFMSCVCITLYACQHAFRAREPLPQFLPSPRHALENLEAHVQDSIHTAREEDTHAMGLSLVYAFAEQEVMKNMVDTLEELLELSGRLFGTTAWLTHEQRMSMTSLHEDTGDRGWYSTFKWEEA
ncbi:hypothetical protein POSPLADRAFT_1136126 [Postia placenta MAD-698-R-SB12]|uniref:DUF2421 domain-containing protein n=1 Tax=Postia placenta MAD-698-R-SB12 TaxID=670580 RepID=A0A1X6N7S2_9APHY|nr:hypothetical protein POSPLADRAFT_1136126 [Postia placenta MAD-698-R-SB12]OSX64677.1 hypothetical protein POSPLADRAFT_1136126 [Postia placenta MAD-698-R-SB12]